MKPEQTLLEVSYLFCHYIEKVLNGSETRLVFWKSIYTGEVVEEAFGLFWLAFYITLW